MIVETVAVGTELLLGQIVNGNAATIARVLAEEGMDAHYQQVVGDNVTRIAAAISLAVGRADAVIITGGIGPTQDDLTREAICAATGLPMDHSQEYEEELRRAWEQRGRAMPESNVRQADHPRGAVMLANPKGSAPGLALTYGGTQIFALPGVPAEMEWLLVHEVIPRLRGGAAGEVIVSRVLRTWGHSESAVARLLDDLYETANPSLAFLASDGEIKVRITAKAADRAGAEEMIAPVEAEARRRLGAAVFGVDDQTIEAVLGDLLSGRGWAMGTAESVTGGAVAARLTSVAGASSFFRGAVVAYQPDLKQSLLGVGGGERAWVSEAVALEMARGACSLLAVEVAVGLTGSAGPEPLERPPGTVVVGVVTPEGERAHTLSLPGDRERVRAYAATAALHLTRRALLGEWWG